MEFGDCTRTYKEHTHSVSAIIENDGLGTLTIGNQYTHRFYELTFELNFFLLLKFTLAVEMLWRDVLMPNQEL